jgi:threonine synthase
MSVKYKSTRGGSVEYCFEEVVLAGLADDKGLYVPESIPRLSLEEIAQVFSPNSLLEQITHLFDSVHRFIVC